VVVQILFGKHAGGGGDSGPVKANRNLEEGNSDS